MRDEKKLIKGIKTAADLVEYIDKLASSRDYWHDQPSDCDCSICRLRTKVETAVASGDADTFLRDVLRDHWFGGEKLRLAKLDACSCCSCCVAVAINETAKLFPELAEQEIARMDAKLAAIQRRAENEERLAKGGAVQLSLLGGFES